MKTLLFLASIEILLFLVVVILLLKILSLKKQVKDLGRENFWHTLAITDDLTGIYNRTAYSNQIAELEKSDKVKGLGIILFDIDDFKAINDNKGHLAGDEVLKFVAEALVRVFPSPKCEVYRIGGDEFAVITRKTTEQQIIQLLIKFRDVLDKHGDIRLSNGYSVVEDDVRSSFKNADEMLYADKASKKKKVPNGLMV